MHSCHQVVLELLVFVRERGEVYVLVLDSSKKLQQRCHLHLIRFISQGKTLTNI